MIDGIDKARGSGTTGSRAQCHLMSSADPGFNFPKKFCANC